MVEVPEELARAIMAGDAVLWAGAGFGALAGRPGWQELLGRLIPRCPDEQQPALRDLIEQGRLRTVLSYVHRHYGDAPLTELLLDVVGSEGAAIPDSAQRLIDLPWKACFATTYADVIYEIFTKADRHPDVLAHTDAHFLSLRDREGKELFILRTPPTGRTMRADAVFFDLVEEVVRSRTILFLGFDPDDPDFAQILDLLSRIGRGKEHYAWLPFVAEAEAEELSEQHGIHVMRSAKDVDIVAAIDKLADACKDVAVRPSDAAGRLAVLDLARAVRRVNVRADLALEYALTLDIHQLEALIGELPGGNLAGVDPTTLLRTGSVLLAHGRLETARKAFQQVISRGSGREYSHIARFNLALVAYGEGDAEAAVDGFLTAAETDRNLALVPPRYEIREILARAGTRVVVACEDRETSDKVDITVSTLPRPVGRQEQARFSAEVSKLVELGHPTLGDVKGGFSDGRLMGVVSAPTRGFILADLLPDQTPMTLQRAFEVVGPLLDGLEACHEVSVLHRNINPKQVVVTPSGPVLRGFGFPVLVGLHRGALYQASPGYIAPEVLEGREPDASADVYALSAVLYHCLTGHSPAGCVPVPSAFSDNLDGRIDDLMRTALHPDPAQRMSLTDLRSELAHIQTTPDLAHHAARAKPSLAPDLDDEGPTMIVSRPTPPPETPDLGKARRAATGPRPVLVRDPSEDGVPEVVEIPDSVRIKLPDDPDDLESWAWILERRPTHSDARQAVDRLERTARDDEQWDRLADVLRVRAQVTQVQKDRIELLQELVGLFEEKLEAPASAFETMHTLIDAVSVPRQVELVDELARLGEVTGRWSELAQTMSAIAGRVTDPARQAALYDRLGKIHAEQLGSMERAAGAYERANELDPGVEDRLQSLVEAYRRLERPAELVASMLSLADTRTGTPRLDTLLDAAQVLRADLDDAEGAFAASRAILGEDPGHRDASELAESLARELERYEDLVEILTQRAERTTDEGEAADLRREAAALALDEKKDRSAAIEQYSKLVEANRADKDSAKQLVKLLRQTVMTDPSRRAALIDAIGILIELSEPNEERADLLSECAGLLDQEADGRDRAADCRAQIVDLLPPSRPRALEAAQTLEKHYRKYDDNDALARLYERQTSPDTDDPGLRTSAWQKLLDLRKAESSEAGIIEALVALTELEPGNTEWRDELLECYLAASDFKKAGPLIRAQVFDEKDPKRKAELLLRGGILREQIGKIDGAVEALEEAVRLQPSLTEAWMALRDLYEEHGQPLKAIEAQVAAARSTSNRLERTKLTFESARAYIERLDKTDRGLSLLEEVVELDPDHREATGMLLDRLVKRDDLVRAWPHAQTFVMQARSQSADDHDLNLRALTLAGRCALAVKETDRAREYLEKAKTLEATNMDVLRLLADLDMAAQRWSEALRNYQSVVLGVGTNLDPVELSQLYMRMAQARVGMGEPSKAVQMTDRALELDPDNERAAELMLQIARDAGDLEGEARAIRQQIDLWARREEGLEDQKFDEQRDRRIAGLVELAGLQTEKMRKPDDAIRTLEEVLELQITDDPAVLHRILDLFTEAERWRDATKILARLADAQDSDQARAKYLWAGALLLRDHVHDLPKADNWFRQVLEADPLHDRAFNELATGLEKRKAWRDLSKVIRARLKALPDSADPRLRVALFHSLGELYSRHLGDPKTALVAYEQAIKLAGPDEKAEVTRGRRLDIMRFAVQLGDDELDKAVSHGHALIADMPMEFETYHRLVELYLRQSKRGRARAVARTLRFLKQADEAELELAEEGSGAGQVRSTVTRDLWRHGIYHASENPRLSDVLSIIWPIVAAREGRTHAHFGVDRDEREPVTLQSPTGLPRYLAWACQVLDAPVPDLFVLDDDPGDLKVAALADAIDGEIRTVYPSVLAGSAATAQQGESSLKFRAGRAVARVRPEHILASVLPSGSSVRNAFYGAVAATKPDSEIPGESAKEAASYAKQIKRYVQPARQDQLGKLVAKITTFGERETRDWFEGVAYTVTRAGFVLADSLETAARILTQEGDVIGSVPSKELIRDLVAYSVSEGYLRLRREIGLR